MLVTGETIGLLVRDVSPEVAGRGRRACLGIDASVGEAARMETGPQARPTPIKCSSVVS